MEDKPAWLSVRFHVAAECGDGPEGVVDGRSRWKLAGAHLGKDLELKRGEDLSGRALGIAATSSAQPEQFDSNGKGHRKEREQGVSAW